MTTALALRTQASAEPEHAALLALRGLLSPVRTRLRWPVAAGLLGTAALGVGLRLAGRPGVSGLGGLLLRTLRTGGLLALAVGRLLAPAGGRFLRLRLRRGFLGLATGRPALALGGRGTLVTAALAAAPPVAGVFSHAFRHALHGALQCLGWAGDHHALLRLQDRHLHVGRYEVDLPLGRVGREDAHLH